MWRGRERIMFKKTGTRRERDIYTRVREREKERWRERGKEKGKEY